MELCSSRIIENVVFCRIKNIFDIRDSVVDFICEPDAETPVVSTEGEISLQTYVSHKVYNNDNVHTFYFQPKSFTLAIKS